MRESGDYILKTIMNIVRKSTEHRSITEDSYSSQSMSSLQDRWEQWVDVIDH
jgi:hypothetical protein